MSCGCAYACIRFPNSYRWINRPYSFKYLLNYGNNGNKIGGSWKTGRLVSRPLARNFGGEQKEMGKDEASKDDKKLRGMTSMIEEGNLAILSSCFVGLLTGIGIVLFNNAVRPNTFLAFLGK